MAILDYKYILAAMFFKFLLINLRVPMKVFIYGDCVSRDIFNFDNEKKYNVVKYYSGSIISSSFGSATVDDVWSEHASSTFQKRVISNDLNKSLMSEIKKSNFDIFLMDFTSERYSLFIFNNGARCTLSAEILGREFPHNDISVGRKITPFSNEMFLLWEVAWQRFINVMAALNKKDLIVINEVYFADQVEDGSSFNGQFNDSTIMEANNYLAKIYSRVLEDIPKSRFISTPSQGNFAAANHPWGRRPFYFIDEHYQFKLKSIFSIAGRNNKDVIEENIEISINDICKLDFPLSRKSNYTIRCGDNTSFQVYSSGIFSQSKIFVCFSGAVSDRLNKKPPFFSGRNIQKEFGIPLISISDPTLEMDDGLRLAWYAGNEDNKNLPVNISVFLDSIASKNNAELIFFGGSGGGFAALMQAALVKSRFKVLVWNPQTDISKYSRRFVTQYISVAFPTFYLENIDVFNSDISDNSLKAMLEECLYCQSIPDIRRDNNFGTIYLQNHNDWHRLAHAKPYLETLGFRRLDNQTSLLLDNIGIIYTYYGDGHAAPEKNDVLYLLSQLIANDSFDVIYSKVRQYSLNQFPSGFIDMQRDIDWSAHDFNVSLKYDNSEYQVEVYSSYQPVDYAFYLMRSGVKEKVVPYSKCNTLNLNVQEDDYELVCFIRAVSGARQSKRILLKPIESEI